MLAGILGREAVCHCQAVPEQIGRTPALALLIGRGLGAANKRLLFGRRNRIAVVLLQECFPGAVSSLPVSSLPRLAEVLARTTA